MSNHAWQPGRFYVSLGYQYVGSPTLGDAATDLSGPFASREEAEAFIQGLDERNWQRACVFLCFGEYRNNKVKP